MKTRGGGGHSNTTKKLAATWIAIAPLAAFQLYWKPYLAGLPSWLCSAAQLKPSTAARARNHSTSYCGEWFQLSLGQSAVSWDECDPVPKQTTNRSVQCYYLRSHRGTRKGPRTFSFRKPKILHSPSNRSLFHRHLWPSPFCFLWVWQLLKLHITESYFIQCLSLCAGLISLSVRSAMSTHVSGVLWEYFINFIYMYIYESACLYGKHVYTVSVKARWRCQSPDLDV